MSSFFSALSLDGVIFPVFLLSLAGLGVSLAPLEILRAMLANPCEEFSFVAFIVFIAFLKSSRSSLLNVAVTLRPEDGNCQPLGGEAGCGPAPGARAGTGGGWGIAAPPPPP